MIKISVLPNLITSANAFCGLLSLVMTFRGVVESNPEFISRAAWYIFLGMAFDAMDGKIARMVNAASDFGAQLDSLSDLVTFGVAPAFLSYALMTQATEFNTYQETFLFMSMALFVCCALLRLARFNVEAGLDESDHRYFNGMPTPAAAGLIASLVLMYFDEKMSTYMDIDLLRKIVVMALPWYLILCALLMVSSIKFVHLISLLSGTRMRFEVLVGVVVLMLVIRMDPELSFVTLTQLYLLSGVVLIRSSLGKEDGLDHP